jgi:hypothetical protein
LQKVPNPEYPLSSKGLNFFGGKLIQITGLSIMMNIPIKMCLGILCSFIIFTGTKETSAAPTIKFSPVGTWEISVEEDFDADGGNEKTDDLIRERLKLSIIRKGNFFLIRFVRPASFVGPGISFPDTALKARLRGNSLYGQLKIDDQKQNLVISFEESNMTVRGKFSIKSSALLFDLEASYKITGHLSHPDMVSLLKLNRSVLENTCNKNVSKVRNLLKAEIVSITNAGSACQVQRDKLDNNNANLKISLDKKNVKIKKLKKGIIKSEKKIEKYDKQLKLSSSRVDAMAVGNVTKSNNIKNLKNKVRKLKNSKENLTGRLTRTSARLFDLEKSLEKVVNTLNKKAEENQKLTKEVIDYQRRSSKEKKENIKYQKYIINLKKALKEISKRNKKLSGQGGQTRKCIETVKSKKDRYLNASQLNEILKHCSY